MNLKSIKILLIFVLLLFFQISVIQQENETNAAANITELEVTGEKFNITIPERHKIWEFKPEIFPHEVLQQFKEEHNRPNRLHAEMRENEFTSRNLLGFSGKYYANQVNGKSIEVLDESINISNEGFWQAKGMVRNELLENVGEIIVKAILYSENGKVLEEVTTNTLIKSVRPGEPVPFIMESSTPVAKVARIDWLTEAVPDRGDISRELELLVYYQLLYGQEKYRGQKRDDAPYPYVLATGFDNYGTKIKEAKIVVAWLDEKGKIFWLETSSLAPIVVNGVPEKGGGNFERIVVSDEKIAPYLSELDYIVWLEGNKW